MEVATQTKSADAPAPIPATEAAIRSGSTSEYRQARRAERAGKPLAEVEAKPATAAADAASDTGTPDSTASAPATAAGEPRLSKRQQDINDRAQRAVESATAQLREENERLKAQLAAPRREEPPTTEPAAPAQTETKKDPDYKRIMALPGAPKLGDFDSVEEFAWAANEFTARTREHERTEADGRQADRNAYLASEQAADRDFSRQLEDAKKTDPEFSKKLSADVRALAPVEWFGRDKQGRTVDRQGNPVTLGPRHVLASEIRKSPMVREVMLHLSQHPDALQKFEQVPAAISAIADPGRRTAAHVHHIVAEFKRLEGRLSAGASTTAADPEPKNISDAPDPARTLGTRPVETTDEETRAIRGGTRAYRQFKRRERAGNLVRR